MASPGDRRGNSVSSRPLRRGCGGRGVAENRNCRTDASRVSCSHCIGITAARSARTSIASASSSAQEPAPAGRSSCATRSHDPPSIAPSLSSSEIRATARSRGSSAAQRAINARSARPVQVDRAATAAARARASIASASAGGSAQSRRAFPEAAFGETSCASVARLAAPRKAHTARRAPARLKQGVVPPADGKRSHEQGPESGLLRSNSTPPRIPLACGNPRRADCPSSTRQGQSRIEAERFARMAAPQGAPTAPPPRETMTSALPHRRLKLRNRRRYVFRACASSPVRESPLEAMTRSLMHEEWSNSFPPSPASLPAFALR